MTSSLCRAPSTRCTFRGHATSHPDGRRRCASRSAGSRVAGRTDGTRTWCRYTRPCPATESTSYSGHGRRRRRAGSRPVVEASRSRRRGWTTGVERHARSRHVALPSLPGPHRSYQNTHRPTSCRDWRTSPRWSDSILSKVTFNFLTPTVAIWVQL